MSAILNDPDPNVDKNQTKRAPSLDLEEFGSIDLDLHTPDARGSCSAPVEPSARCAELDGVVSSPLVTVEHPKCPEDDFAALEAFMQRCSREDALARSGPLLEGRSTGAEAVATRSCDTAGYAPATASDTIVGGVHPATGRIEAIVPWPEAVDGALLAEAIRVRVESHVVFTSRHDAVLATLWILGTYFMIGWRLWPRLLITAATKGSGKSVLLEVIHAFAFRSLMFSNSSPPALFRLIERWAPTLCLDEADQWVKQNRELASILNSGHSRAAAFVIRAGRGNGADGDVDFFSTWCPIVLAGIGTQRDTLTSRSIVIALQPKLSTEDIRPLDFDMRESSSDTRRQILRWSQDNLDAVKASQALPPDCGDSRRRDNFRPLWQLADVLGGPWPQLLEEAYRSTLPEADGEDDGPGVMLLRDLRAMFAAEGSKPAIRTADVIGRLAAMDESPWATWHRGKAMTPHQLAKLLKPFGVRSYDRRELGGVAKSYMRDEVELAYSRFGALPRSHP